MKVGVIGTGNMGENHVQTYVSLHPHCECVGIFDTDERKSRIIAKKYNVRQFHSLHDLLQSVDAVSIAVPTEYHYEIGLACIKHKVHMLMEKPITNTTDEAEDLIHRANEAGVKIQVGHIELFNPFIQYLQKEIKNEKIIEIVHERMAPEDKRLKTVDVVKDLMIHDLYIVQHLLNEELKDFQVFGKAAGKVSKHAVVVAKTQNSGTIHLTASFKAREKKRIIRILTEEAYIEADILKREMYISRSLMEVTNKLEVPVRQRISFDGEIQPLYVELLDFIKCIKNDKVPYVTGEDGLNVLKLCNKISEALI